MGIVAQGTCRSLIIYRCETGDQGVYVCDALDAQTSASLRVQGEFWTERGGWAGKAGRWEWVLSYSLLPQAWLQARDVLGVPYASGMPAVLVNVLLL